MNKFEHEVQSKNNDVVDGGLAFVIGFIGFAVIYAVPHMFEIVGRLLG